MLLLDEFANLGRLDELDEISKALGLGIRPAGVPLGKDGG
jgi:hypothetical protein